MFKKLFDSFFIELKIKNRVMFFNEKSRSLDIAIGLEKVITNNLIENAPSVFKEIVKIKYFQVLS